MRMSHATILVGMLLAAAPHARGAETLYVRPDGSDAADGLTPATALASIQEAVNRCDGAGHTIFVAPGVYREQVEIGTGSGAGAAPGEETSPNRIVGDPLGAETGAGPGGVVIDGGAGARAHGVLIERRAHWRIEHLAFRGHASYAVLARDADGLVVGSCIVESPASYGIHVARSDGARIEGNVIDHSGFPRSVRGRQWAVGIGIYAWAPEGRIRISSNRVMMTGAAHLSTAYRHTRSTRKPYYGIIAYAAGTGSGRGRSAGGIIVENNVLSDCSIGIYAIAWRGRGEVQLLHNSAAGCSYAIFAYAYQSTIGVADSIVTDSFHAVGAQAFRGGKVRVAGLMTNALSGESVLESGGSRGRHVHVSGLIENTDPAWVDPASGNLALAPGSPAIDAGLGSRFSSGEDIRGGPRPYDGNADGVSAPDLGAWEYNPQLDGAAPPRIIRWVEVEPGG